MSDMKTKHQTLRDNGINIDQLNEDKPLLVKTILSSMVEYAQLFHEFKLANDTKKEESVLPIDIVIDNSIINRDITYKGKDYKVYNVNLMLAPDNDGSFENVFYQKLRDS